MKVLKRYSLWLRIILLWQEGEFLAKCFYNGFDENRRNVIKSVAKSITSVAAGIMLDRGLLKSVDEPIYKFIPQLNEGRDLRHVMITVVPKKKLIMVTQATPTARGMSYDDLIWDIIDNASK